MYLDVCCDHHPDNRETGYSNIQLHTYLVVVTATLEFEDIEPFKIPTALTTVSALDPDYDIGQESRTDLRWQFCSVFLISHVPFSNHEFEV